MANCGFGPSCMKLFKQNTSHGEWLTFFWGSSWVNDQWRHKHSQKYSDYITARPQPSVKETMLFVLFSSRWRNSNYDGFQLVSKSKQKWHFEKTCPCAIPPLALLNCGEALEATTEFITLNERLCSRPHSITHEPDDKLHCLPWLPDPKGCLINQRLDMATISGSYSGQGCPGPALTPTPTHLTISPALTLAARCEYMDAEHGGRHLWDPVGAVTNTNCYLNMKQPQLLIRLEYE